MYCFRVKTYTVAASFRIPESHTFQQSLPLPPVTTLIGIMGAAMGFCFEDAMKFRVEKGLNVGVTGTHCGEFKDLWKYRKIKAKMVISDVLLREYLADLEMSLYFASESGQTLEQVRNSFLSPCFALTAGNSDDLLKIRKVDKIFEADDIPLFQFSHTVLSGDHTENYEPQIDLKKLPITESICAPQVYLLPTAFNFNGSERRVIRREPFTFVGSAIKLKDPAPGIRVSDEVVALL